MDEVGHARRQPGIHARKHLVNARRRVEHDALGPRFVSRRTRDGLFEEVGERSMPQVMEKRGCQRLSASLEGDVLSVRKDVLESAKSDEQLLHDERGAKGVRKPRVLGARKSQGGDAQLTDSPKPLHLRGIHQRLDDRLLRALEGDQAMDRIAKDHGASTVQLPTLPSSCQTRTAMGPRGALSEASRRAARVRTPGALSECQSA